MEVGWTVPFEFEAGARRQHAPMVRVWVGGDGVETRFIVDTGSTDHVFTLELANRLNLKLHPIESGKDHAGASVRSWTSMNTVSIGLTGKEVELSRVIVIEGPPQFGSWGIGGFLSPQHLMENGWVVLDLRKEREQMVGANATVEELKSWMGGQVVELKRSGEIDIVATYGAIEPFGEVLCGMNTGSAQTEFTASALPGVGEGKRVETTGMGVSGEQVFGVDVHDRMLCVGGCEGGWWRQWLCARRWERLCTRVMWGWMFSRGPYWRCAQTLTARCCGWRDIPRCLFSQLNPPPSYFLAHCVQLS